MSLINSLENKLGRHAIPGLVNLIAGFQVAVWILLRLQPDFLHWLTLNKTMLLRGEVWRLVTFVFIPAHANPLWMVLAVMLLLTVGRTLDHAWGAFRVNLYVLAGIVFSAAGVLLQQWALDDLLRNPAVERSLGRDAILELSRGADLGGMCSLWFSASLFFAFACVVPDYEILLFLILPLKTKYIAMITGAGMLLTFVDSAPVRTPMFFCLLNFFLAFGPTLWRRLAQRRQVSARRARFDAAQRPADSFLHKCHACGKTELDDPKLDFRVAADGEDYCSLCRPRKPAP